jgi:signal transduction histidine kinase
MREGELPVRSLQPSGRVIASGRLLLASLFVVAVWTDASQPARAHLATYVLLAAYLGWSLVLTLLVWDDWWHDARLAAPAHVIDVAVFMIMLYSTEGYTSPYFTFFIFILLSAAIRWGWKETSVTALAVVAVYFTVGMMLGPSPEFEVGRFIVRTGHLLIISAILIWFGANQWIARPQLASSRDPDMPASGDPFVAALQSGMMAVGARRGTLLWRQNPDEDVQVVGFVEGRGNRSTMPAGTSLPPLAGSLLFNLKRDRALMRSGASGWRFLAASDALPPEFRKRFEGDEGLAVPIASGTAAGLTVFQDVPALSTDHLDQAPRLERDMAARLQEAALFDAVEEHSMAKARVAVARDLHDSVVQFLAGLGFRLEALNRSAGAEGEIAEGLSELKDTVMTEQRQLRAFIKGLRTGKPVSIKDLTRDCASLCQLLARQWDIDCVCGCEGGAGYVSVRTQLDIQHLVREAVANAVRHGEATRVTVGISREGDHVRLLVVDNGHGFAAKGKVQPPASLHSRVREAGGELEVTSKAGETSVTIRLPVEEEE